MKKQHLSSPHYFVRLAVIALSILNAYSGECLTLGLGKASAHRGAEIEKKIDSNANSISLSGPTTGVVSTRSSSFSVKVNGNFSEPVTLTISDQQDGGILYPLTMILSPSTRSGSFTYTPATLGPKTISITNSGNLKNPSPWTFTSIPPGEPATSSAYRAGQPYLFQPVNADYPSTLGGNKYSTDVWGPTINLVDFGSGWTWKHPGGDWLDANLIPQGTTPWAYFDADLSVYHRYTGIDVTRLMQYVQGHNKWAAFILGEFTKNSATFIQSNFSPSQPVPVIHVTYADSTSADLLCRVVAANYDSQSSRTPPSTQFFRWSVPVFLEFERPTKPVSTAHLDITVMGGYKPKSTLQLFLLDPPFNTDPATDQTGLASQAGNLDANIASIPNVIGAQRYVDGTTLTDFVVPGPINYLSEDSYSPEFWGGAVDKTKLPYRANSANATGKWVNIYNTGSLSLVPSTYNGDGFVPLSSGLGAMRLHMSKSNIKAGEEGGYAGTDVLDARLFLPPEEMGLMSHIFVRYYLRVGSPLHFTPANRLEVLSSGIPAWSSLGGMWGISPDHTTSYSGYGSASARKKGYQLRHSWQVCEANLGGPDEDALNSGWYINDFRTLVEFPTSVQPQDILWGQRGGMGGTFYTNQWYEIETEVQLNSINPHAADGLLRVWVDGRLVYEHTNLDMRETPYFDPGYTAGKIRPMRELGFKSLAWNFFNGDPLMTQSVIDVTTFITGLVWAKERIGAMNKQAH